ncbi:MAG TPA: type IV pilus assembly protein PilM [Kiritimatiellia bacterium]|nr:type IV pilus assembly protein PilM [Kiritimatiellia bacterium]HPS07878.1 type IV pilus assembly protein PilM [Kiritimatiellia bacterium]
MFSSDRILALNVGASKIVLAEFIVRSGRPPELTNYGMSELGVDPENDTGVGSHLVASLREIMKARGIRPAPMMLSLSGQMVFPRFVRLPAVSEDKLLQMVQYEVEQNVPFPMDEIVWNHQFIGDASSGEQSAMIVAAKIENVREITDRVVEMGLEPEIVDVAPMALYNCLRYNYADLSGCTVVLDIGARSTNLIFVEDDKIYNRCIPVAGNAITQELAKSFQIPYAEAEALKRQQAFVSLGGVYATEDETAERISKIVRNVVTRLHAEISRSVNFYRSQQGGNAPVRMFLTGGSSVLPHLDTFFREKLQVEVAYLNPFANIGLSNRINRERVGGDAFVLSECVGLALRRSLACPVEINLMPPEIVKRKSFKKRIPFFGLAAAGVLMCLGIWAMYEKQMAKLYEFQGEQVSAKLASLKSKQSHLSKAEKSKESVQLKADAVRDVILQRTAWLKRVDAIRKSLFEGMWLTEMTPVKDGNGDVTGVRIVGRGWVDKLKQVEEKAKVSGRNATAVEELRDRLKTQSVFGKEPQDVKIVGVKDVEAYMIEFTIEAALASASVPKDATAR